MVNKDLKVGTVEDNMKFISKSQRNKAKAARKIIQDLGTTTTTDLKAIIRLNLVKDYKVNTEDINLSERTCGPDAGSMKGRLTRSNTKPITLSFIELPEELLSMKEDVSLSIDGLSINGLKFLTTVSYDIYYRTL